MGKCLEKREKNKFYLVTYTSRQASDTLTALLFSLNINNPVLIVHNKVCCATLLSVIAVLF